MTINQDVKRRRELLGLSQSALAELVARRAGKKFSQQALAKFEGNPESESKFSIHILEELDYQEKKQGPLIIPATDMNVSMAHSSHQNSGLVWHISWVVAGDWCEAIDIFHPGDGFDQIPCPEPHSPGTIALTVGGSSMDDGTEDGYKDGEIIFVDPEITPIHNSDVVARTPDGTATFKRLQVTPEGKFLVALNPDWPQRVILAPEGTVICGVVIGSYKRRRK